MNKKEEKIEYNEDSVVVLEGLEAVRKRPGMYCGGLDENGMHKLFFEVVDNAIDEHIAGYANFIFIEIADDYVKVVDDGRGIPVGINKKYNINTLELILTRLHAGGKFDENSYKFSSGLHGVGVSVVNALSSQLVAKVLKNHVEYQQIFECGIPKSKLEETPCLEWQFNNHNIKNGTEIRFTVDKSMFKQIEWNFESIKNYIFNLCCLNSNLTIVLSNQLTNFEEQERTYCYKNLTIEDLMPKNLILQKSVRIVVDEYEIDKGQFFSLEVFFNFYNEKSLDENVISFVNNVNTPNGGTHVTVVKNTFTRFFNDILKKSFKKNEVLMGSDIRRGSIFIINARLTNPIFSGQTKEKLTSEIVNNTSVKLYNQLKEYFMVEQDQLKTLINKFLDNQKDRKFLEEVRNKTFAEKADIIDSSFLPGKLADCSSKDTTINEIILVEGESAGGTAKQARNREFQAILSLKGKVLNVEKHNFKKAFSNAEILAFFNSLGLTIKNGVVNYDNLRYGKILILSDADPDGHHIRILILVLIFKYARRLIEEGRVFILQSPIFSIKIHNTTEYFNDEEKYEKRLLELKGKKITIQRFKGLGEMLPEQLLNTTMKVENRILIQIQMEDPIFTETQISKYMGFDSTFRRNTVLAYDVENENKEIEEEE